MDRILAPVNGQHMMNPNFCATLKKTNKGKARVIMLKPFQ